MSVCGLHRNQFNQIANCRLPIANLKTLGCSSIGNWQSTIGNILALAEELGVFQIVPGLDCGQRLVVRHVAAKRRH
jgi:hypothetical protein